MERTFGVGGRVTDWVEPNGDRYSRFYDGSGRVSEEIDPLGNSTTYSYDAAGRLASVTDQVLGATTTFERDVAGRVTKTIDALTNETLTSYRLGGRLESTTDARGFTTTFARGPTVSSVTDPLMRTTTSTSSVYGLPQGTTFPDATGTSSDYLGTTRVDGSQGFPTTLTDELTRQRSFGYDAQSGLTSATDLAGQQWQYSYAASARRYYKRPSGLERRRTASSAKYYL